MFIFGWLLLLIGLSWAGLGLIALVFMFRDQAFMARDLAPGVYFLGVTVLFLLPGLGLAGLGGLLTRRTS